MLSSKDATCDDVAPYVVHSAYRVAPDDPNRNVEPDDPVTQEECSTMAQFAPVLKATKAKKFAEFGPGALVEGTAPGVGKGRRAVAVFVLDQDDKWKAIIAEEFKPQIGTKLAAKKAGRRRTLRSGGVRLPHDSAAGRRGVERRSRLGA